MSEAKKTLDIAQKNASRKVFTSRLAVITGPGGTGKTETVIHIAEVESRLRQHEPIRKHCLHNVFLSPTGKAVDNVKARLNLPTDDTCFKFMTVHAWVLMALKGQIRVGSINVLGVDEAGMMSLWVTYYLLREARRLGVQRIVLLGDSYQLSPVGGTGSLLQACMGHTVNVTLTKNFRTQHVYLQKTFELLRTERKTIKHVAATCCSNNEVNIVKVQCTDKFTNPYTNKPEQTHVELIKAANEIVESLTPDQRQRTRIITANKNLSYNSFKDCKKRTLADNVLACLFNERHDINGNEKWTVGDLVISTTNYYEEAQLKVANGSEGIVTSWNEQSKEISIDFRNYTYTFPSPTHFCDEKKEARHRAVYTKLLKGTTRTVHKYQGSEADIIIALFRTLHNKADGFRTRELLYTAASRAKCRLYLVFDSNEYAKYEKLQRTQPVDRYFNRILEKALFSAAAQQPDAVGWRENPAS